MRLYSSRINIEMVLSATQVVEKLGCGLSKFPFRLAARVPPLRSCRHGLPYAHLAWHFTSCLAALRLSAASKILVVISKRYYTAA